uniref:Uncharacterized protein n=1 Tax=Siphoviridae sp. ctAUQ2 TaxID=2826182 RepID=A0A8S5MZW6_9CAUD|nr:MAG TPA: hypothetical protein [Siphoviridae sp. ctAUQ2]
MEGIPYSGITVYIGNLKQCVVPFLFSGSIAAQSEIIKFYQGRHKVFFQAPLTAL